MTLAKILKYSAFTLGGLFLFQIALLATKTGESRLHASWANLADTLEEGVDLSTQVVLGEVVKVRRAPDIMVRLPVPDGELIRIPAEIVTVKVQKIYKDREALVTEGSSIEIFHTGLGYAPRIIPSGDEDPEDLQGQGKAQRRGKRPDVGHQGRSIHLEDDPPYFMSEQAVYFLRDGPELERGKKVKRVIAPEGRYRIATGNTLDPVTDVRGFAPKWAGRPLSELEDALNAIP